MQNRQTRFLLFAAIIGVSTNLGCSAVSHSRQAAAVKDQHMNPEQFRCFVESKVTGCQNLEELRANFDSSGFSTTLLDDGRILANREIPAAFPTSMWYSAVLRNQGESFEILKTEVMGKDP